MFCICALMYNFLSYIYILPNMNLVSYDHTTLCWLYHINISIEGLCKCTDSERGHVRAGSQGTLPSQHLARLFLICIYISVASLVKPKSVSSERNRR